MTRVMAGRSGFKFNGRAPSACPLLFLVVFCFVALAQGSHERGTAPGDIASIEAKVDDLISSTHLTRRRNLNLPVPPRRRNLNLPVPPTPVSPNDDLQAMVETAAPYTELVLENGTYTYAGSTTFLKIVNSITIRALHSGGVIIDGNYRRVIQIEPSELPRLIRFEGLTITKGFPREGSEGGGIHIDGGSSDTHVDVVDCDIIKNNAQAIGAGVYVASGTVSFVASNISLNTVSTDADEDDFKNSGGGVYVRSGTVSFDSCVFVSNTVSGLGGAIYIYDGDVSLARLSFFDNKGAGDAVDNVYVKSSNDVSVCAYPAALVGPGFVGTDRICEAPPPSPPPPSPPMPSASPHPMPCDATINLILETIQQQSVLLGARKAQLEQLEQAAIDTTDELALVMQELSAIKQPVIGNGTCGEIKAAYKKAACCGKSAPQPPTKSIA